MDDQGFGSRSRSVSSSSSSYACILLLLIMMMVVVVVGAKSRCFRALSLLTGGVAHARSGYAIPP